MKNMFERFEAEAFQQSIDKLTRESAIHSAMKAVNAASLHQENIDKLMGGSAIHSAMKAINAANSYQENIDKLMGGGAIQSALKVINAASSYQEDINKLMGGSTIRSALKAIHAASTYQENIDKLMCGSAIQSAMKVISATSANQKILDQIISNNSFQKAIAVLTEQANLLSALDVVAHSNELPDTDLIEYDIDRQLQEIGKAKDSGSFLNIFSKLHPAIQTLLVFIILHLLLPITQNITANLITPHVEKIISNPESTEREKVRQLKAFSLDELDLSNLRFVTTELLIVRESPSTSSKVKDELRFGQIVTMVNKQRNWMEISYTYKDGEIIHGWVFSRYIAKFNK